VDAGSADLPEERAEELRDGSGDALRSVLMVLYHFPPNGGVSMSRNVSHIRYLRGYGWNPVVLAPRAAGEITDPGALALVPASVRVVRALCPEPGQLAPMVALLRGVSSRVGRTCGRLPVGRSGPGAGAPAAPDPTPDAERMASRSSRISRLRRLVFFPDNQIAWLPFAVAAAVRLRRVAPYDVVYSSSSPVTAHLIAGVIKRLTGVRWVAEFRDPWVGNPLAEPLPWLQRRIRARLERWIARSADRIVFLSPSTLRSYRRRYPDAPEMVLITNGHDSSEARPPVAGGLSRRRYRIVWTGSLYRPAELMMFLEALHSLAVRRPTLADDLEVVFYGDVEASCRTVAEQLTADGVLDAIVRFPGFVPRQAALVALAESDAALLMLGAGPGMGQFVPGKLFDYLGQSRQILAVLPPGDARDILRELDWGVIADPDPADIERAIERLLVTAPPARLADPDGTYDRARLAARLAETFREAIAADPGRPVGRPGRRRSGAAG
jgi:glycosyltransferase involved in cell wall biosynthesis